LAHRKQIFLCAAQLVEVGVPTGCSQPKKGVPEAKEKRLEKKFNKEGSAEIKKNKNGARWENIKHAPFTRVNQGAKNSERINFHGVYRTQGKILSVPG